MSKLSASGSGLIYSTYLGGSDEDLGGGIAVDSTGNTHVTGRTLSVNFPTASPFQPVIGGSFDAFVTKLNPSGSALVYSSFLGGVGSFDLGRGIAVDSAGNAYVTGRTNSLDFPTTGGAVQTVLGGGSDAFVAKIADVLRVTIDIKPGSFPNSINLGSGGTVPVAIFSTSTFDARSVDPTTVTLASAPVQLRGKGTPMASFEDVTGDGLLDQVVHVSTSALQLSETDTEAILEGKTSSGTQIRGSDSVRVVP